MSAALTTVTLRSPADVLTAVPYVLGFHPQASLVLVVLRDSRLVLTERIDLPATDEPTAEVVDQLGRHVVTNHGEEVIIIGYQHPGGTPATPAVKAMTAWLAEHDVKVMDTYLVEGMRYWTIGCTDEDCCPAQGRPIPTEVESSHLVAEFVAHGATSQPSREAVVAMLEPTPASARVAQLLHGHSPEIPSVYAVDADAVTQRHQAWQRILSPTDRDPIDPHDAAIAAVCLRSAMFRDGLVAWTTDDLLPRDTVSGPVLDLLTVLDDQWADIGGPTTPENIPHVGERLLQLCVTLPDSDAAPALSLLATHAWWRGNGTLAGIAVDRALRAEPDYKLARLLALIVHMGIPPTR